MCFLTVVIVCRHTVARWGEVTWREPEPEEKSALTQKEANTATSLANCQIRDCYVASLAAPSSLDERFLQMHTHETLLAAVQNIIEIMNGDHDVDAT